MTMILVRLFDFWRHFCAVCSVCVCLNTVRIYLELLTACVKFTGYFSIEAILPIWFCVT